MAPAILYTTCVFGALGLYLVVRPGGLGGPRGRRMRIAGAVAGLGAFAYLVAQAGEALGVATGAGRPEAFYAIFSLIAIVCAVQMITTSRPVYSALYFVLVVLSSAGLFLLLEAEFMAFALIIVYAGAILITYMFVLMLAQQAPTSDEAEVQPEYDLNPREPAAGVIVGFILLALLSRMILDGTTSLPAPPSSAEVLRDSWTDLERMPARLEAEIDRQVDETFAMSFDDGVPRLEIDPDGVSARVEYARTDGTLGQVELPDTVRPENVQRVGLSLLADFPVSLELAGVILLMAMFGAVILARKQIELTEDEKREAAGLRRVGHHDDPAHAPGGGPAGGAGNGPGSEGADA